MCEERDEEKRNDNMKKGAHMKVLFQREAKITKYTRSTTSNPFINRNTVWSYR